MRLRKLGGGPFGCLQMESNLFYPCLILADEAAGKGKKGPLAPLKITFLGGGQTTKQHLDILVIHSWSKALALHEGSTHLKWSHRLKRLSFSL